MNRRTIAACTLALIACLAPTGCRDSGHVARHELPAVSSSAARDEPTRVVTLAFAGDVHFQLHLAALLAHPRGALGPITRTLRDADLTMVNLESAVTEGGVPDPKELEVPSERYWFRTSPAALDLLASAGVDVVTMANNHGADYGPSGLADTLGAVRRSPVPVVGIGRDRDVAFAPYRVTIHDTDVAILAADASPREGSSSVWEAGPHTPGIAAARGSHTRALVAAVRRASTRDEVVVVYLHWGVELQACPSRAQRRTARVLAGAGADVVVGSHAHVQLGAGWLGDTYVDFGLGNLLWYHNHQADSGVLRVRVEDGRVVSDEWAPARIQRFGRPLPLRGAPRSEAVARWRALRACADLQPAPHGFVKLRDLRSSQRGDAAR
jgi:poly-gamma-glutamate synthesis protein (capsule biosynthesis protein)